MKLDKDNPLLLGAALLLGGLLISFTVINSRVELSTLEVNEVENGPELGATLLSDIRTVVPSEVEVKLVQPAETEPLASEKSLDAPRVELSNTKVPELALARGIYESPPGYAAIAAAHWDVARLIEIGSAWSKTREEAEAFAEAAFERVLELDENNTEAREGLGHHVYDGKWFRTYAALSKHRRAEAKLRVERDQQVHW